MAPGDSGHSSLLVQSLQPLLLLLGTQDPSGSDRAWGTLPTSLTLAPQWAGTPFPSRQGFPVAIFAPLALSNTSRVPGFGVNVAWIAPGHLVTLLAAPRIHTWCDASCATGVTK